MQKKPAAVVRRDIIASTGPSIYGLKRMQKIRKPGGEVYTFLGVSDGIAYLERDDKTKGEPFVEVDSEDLKDWGRLA